MPGVLRFKSILESNYKEFFGSQRHKLEGIKQGGTGNPATNRRGPLSRSGLRHRWIGERKQATRKKPDKCLILNGLSAEGFLMSAKLFRGCRRLGFPGSLRIFRNAKRDASKLRQADYPAK
jgi:hypothetical protein